LEGLHEAGVGMPDVSRRISSQEMFCRDDKTSSVQNP
jgi:hypothetical protein